MKEIIAVVIHCQFKLLRPFVTDHQKLSRAQVRIIAVDHAVNKVGRFCPYLDISVTSLSSIAGEFEFENTIERVNNTAVFLEIKVVRKNGDNGTVTVTLKGVEGTAIQDQDYGLAETSVQFPDRQV
jgi:hypothetical protein